MRYEIRIILASLLMIIMALQVFGETPSDSAKVYFPAGHRRLDSIPDTDRELMDSFVDKIRKANDEDTIASFVVNGFVSPDGISEHTPLHRFALKSNLLYDAILFPNIEIEWMIKDNWSVAIDGGVAWWRKKKKHKYYDLAMVSVEGCRWFAVKKPWHGFYAGVFVGGGKYDFENGDKGYNGEGVMAGISAGYMFPIGKCLSLDAGIGAGYMHTQYKEYLPIDGHYVYQRTKSLNYFGPLKLKFAIVWRFFDINKRKTAR